jgi:hypothetical protein
VRAGSWRTVGWAAAALLATHSAHGEAPRGAALPCDCSNVTVRWLQLFGHSYNPLEGEFRRRLAEHFRVSLEDFKSASELSSVPDEPGKPQVTILPCSQAEYAFNPARGGTAPFEALNARMLAVPLYVFLREPRVPGSPDRPMRVALACPKGALPSADRLRALLVPLLGTERIELKDVGEPEFLAEALTAERGASNAAAETVDAVALLGEEPSSILERFLARYQNLARSRGLEGDPTVATERASRVAAHVPMKTPARLTYVRLDYPRESLYAFRTDDGGAADSRTMVALSRSSLVGPAAQQSLPLLVSDAAAKARSGRLVSCCWSALKRALADSALLSIRFADSWVGPDNGNDAEREARRVLLVRLLAVEAYLDGRSDSEGPSDRDEKVRGLLLLAQLQLAGYEATLRRVQASTQLAISDDGRKILRSLGIPPKAGARLGFSCDTVFRVTTASNLLAQKESPAPEETQQILGDLTAAIISEPRPARHTPGCGMTQLVDYNPYQPLAQVMSLQSRGRALRAEGSADLPLRVAGVVLLPVETLEGAPE